MAKVNFVNKTSEDLEAWKNLYVELFNTVNNMADIEDKCTVSVIFLSPKEAQELNSKYRNKMYIPDVISFPTDVPVEFKAVLDEIEYGDIFICVDIARQKAQKYNHTLKQEMAFLFVHGYLHLLGYDHEQDEAQKNEMFYLQNKVLINNGINYEIIFDEEDYRIHYGEERS